jgi:hypothetical protein
MHDIQIYPHVVIAHSCSCDGYTMQCMSACVCLCVYHTESVWCREGCLVVKLSCSELPGTGRYCSLFVATDGHAMTSASCLVVVVVMVVDLEVEGQLDPLYFW